MESTRGNPPALTDTTSWDKAFADIATSTASRDRVSFTEQERRVLDRHDQLGELRLERALLEAEKGLLQATDVDDSKIEEVVKAAEIASLEARSVYLLKNSIVGSVLSVDPLLKAVHSGPNGSGTERLLHPLVNQRDVLSLSHANLSASLQASLNTLGSTQTENIKAMQRNQELSSTLVELTSQLKEQDVEQINDVEIRKQLERLLSDMKETKKQNRIMKSVVAAVVVGSGVDWVHDDELRDLAMDSED